MRGGRASAGAYRVARLAPVVDEGQQAPDFELATDTGKRVRLSDFRGSPVVLFFYPKDDTPGCTKEACSFRDAYSEFQERGAVVLGISPDGEASHVMFRDKYSLPYTLLSDPEREVAKAYDVWREKTMYGKTAFGIHRSTFVIGPDGAVVKAMRGVKPDGHADQVLAVLPDSPGV
jgi:peroxiredoxin Q/BCP